MVRTRCCALLTSLATRRLWSPVRVRFNKVVFAEKAGEERHGNGLRAGHLDAFSELQQYQRLPARLTGPPRFAGVPGRTPTPGAPTPGVTARRATGRARNTTPGLATHPAGYETYWQYTTALACSVLAPMNPVISSVDKAIESFILASSLVVVVDEFLDFLPFPPNPPATGAAGGIRGRTRAARCRSISGTPG